MNLKLILWDWNGTLFDDIKACICSMNSMLTKRNISKIDYARYREIFSFPVKEYYKKLGFNFLIEPYEKLAGEYISLYKIHSKQSGLHIGAAKVLKYFKLNNFKQIIISAMEQKDLKKQIKENKIYYYFEEIVGLNNIHAHSKIENAISYFNKIKTMNDAECIFIGDTFHDYEVSIALNCKCILVNNGHQNLNKFKFNKDIIILNNLNEIIDNNFIN